MTNKTLSGWRKAVAVASLGLASILGGSEAVAETPKEKTPIVAEEKSQNNSMFEKFNTRVRFEDTETENAQGDKTRVYRSTFGLTDCSCPEREGLGEFFRVYDDRSISADGKEQHWESIGAKHGFNALGGKLCPSVFGATGDKEGVGTETRCDIGKLSIVGNAEKATRPFDATRLGIGADYKLTDKIIVGAGFDTVEQGEDRTNHFLGKVAFSPSEKDRFGLGISQSRSDLGTVTNSVIGDWGHTNDSFGTRTYVMHSWNNKDWKNTTAESINVFGVNGGKSTFHNPLSYDWMEGRRNGDMFDHSVVPQSVTYAERVPLNYRVSEGVVSRVLGSFTDNAGKESQTLRGDLGYTFAKTDLAGFEIKPGVYLFAQHDKSNFADSRTTVGASGIVNIGKVLGGDLNVEVIGSKSNDGCSQVYAGVVWKINL